MARPPLLWLFLCICGTAAQIINLNYTDSSLEIVKTGNAGGGLYTTSNGVKSVTLDDGYGNVKVPGTLQFTNYQYLLLTKTQTQTIASVDTLVWFDTTVTNTFVSGNIAIGGTTNQMTTITNKSNRTVVWFISSHVRTQNTGGTEFAVWVTLNGDTSPHFGEQDVNAATTYVSLTSAVPLVVPPGSYISTYAYNGAGTATVGGAGYLQGHFIVYQLN